MGDILQYANFRPRNLPAKGIIIMVSKSCSCSKLSSHSFCASEYSGSESRMLLEMEGRESTSSLSEAGASGMTKDSDELVMVDRLDMAALIAVLRCAMPVSNLLEVWLRTGWRTAVIGTPTYGMPGRGAPAGSLDAGQLISKVRVRPTGPGNTVSPELAAAGSLFEWPTTTKMVPLVR